MEFRNETGPTQILELLISSSLTAPDIVKETGYSRPTIDTMLSELVGKRIIRRKGVGKSTGGRRPVIYSLNESGRFAIGVAVAIPKIAGVVVDLAGHIHAQELISIPIWSPADLFINETAGLIKRLLDKVPGNKPFDGIGVAIPGLVDPVNGVSVFYSRLSTFYNTPVRAMLEERLDKKVAVSRYLGSAAYSQIFPIRARTRQPIVYIELGEGIDMALFNDGKPYRGSLLNEGGLGHTVIEVNGRTCLCGAKGCLEAYAANRVLIDEAKLRVRNGEPSAIPADREINDQTFYACVKAGDRLATEVAEQGMEYLAIGISNVINLLNPALVIISGAIANAGEAFLMKIQERIRFYALNVLAQKVEIRFMAFDLQEGAKGVGMLRLYDELNVLV